MRVTMTILTGLMMVLTAQFIPLSQSWLQLVLTIIRLT